ncbi:protein phosphatase [Dyadobacter soli]|uniref:Protein phosphatase n=1 Tax=Dyadobacter soli TaxID=659014 RepID=A0A1G6Y7K3_9BACT|nr:protein phosphatase 2C domain-containing protein [Dyadobacter soli]SDD85565.1 protein phosphatase [Dyadobacter soli]
MKALTVSHKGKRDINQDLIFEYTASDGSYLLAVVDGMGGYDHGEIAASIVCENIVTYLSTVQTIDDFHLQKGINKSNLAIRQHNNRKIATMGATVGGVVIKGNELSYFWIGDVKIFHFRNKKLLFESTPHTLVNDLVENGSIIELSQLSKYRHVVTRSIQGNLNTSQAVFYTNTFDCSTDILFVCSDGVHDLFDGLQLERMLNDADSLADLNVELESRLDRDASDNFTFGLICFD